MTHRTTLGEKIAGAIFSAFGEQVMDGAPELRALAGACGYTASVAPSRAIRTAQRAAEEAAEVAEGAIGDALDAGLQGLRERLRAKVKAKRGAKPKAARGEVPSGAGLGLDEKLRQVFDGLSPFEKEMVEQMLREKKAPEDVIDLVRQKDGAFAPKEKR